MTKPFVEEEDDFIDNTSFFEEFFAENDDKTITMKMEDEPEKDFKIEKKGIKSEESHVFRIKKELQERLTEKTKPAPIRFKNLMDSIVEEQDEEFEDTFEENVMENSMDELEEAWVFEEVPKELPDKFEEDKLEPLMEESKSLAIAEIINDINTIRKPEDLEEETKVVEEQEVAQESEHFEADNSNKESTKLQEQFYKKTQNVPIPIKRKKTGGFLYAIAAIIACLIFGIGLLFYNEYMIYASVYISINPEVKIDVNKKDIVINLEGINTDGAVLIQEYDFAKKDIETVVDELMEIAIEKGYLQKGANVKLILESSHVEWTQEHRDSLNAQISKFLSGLSADMNITVELEETEVDSNTSVDGTNSDELNTDGVDDDDQNLDNQEEDSNNPDEDDRENTTNRDEKPSTNSTENSDRPDNNTTNDSTENDNPTNNSTEDTNIPDDNTSNNDVENSTSDDTQNIPTTEDNNTSESTEDEGTDDDNSGDNTSAGDTSDDDSSSEGNDDSENVENSGTLDPIISKDL